MDSGICGGDESAGRMVAIVVLSFICVLTVFGNTMVLLAFLRNKFLRSFGNYFLISLAISDLVMGCWTFPNTIASLALCKSWMSDLLCEVSGYIDNVILTNSLVTLAACSYDRYLVITKPLFYKRSMTGRRTLLILTATWIYSMVLSVPPFCGIGAFQFSPFSRTCALRFVNETTWSRDQAEDKYQEFKIYFSSYVIFTFIPPLSMMIGCYFKIFQTAKQVNANDPNLCKQGGAGPWKGIKHYKAGIMIAVIIGVYLVFAMPVTIMAGVQVVFDVKGVPRDGALVVIYLVMCNSCCNPIIYGIMNKDFRKTFKNILSCRSDRTFRQMNYRRESLAYSSSTCNGSSLLVKKKNDHSTSSNFSMGSTVSSNLSVDKIRSNTELKRYFHGQQQHTQHTTRLIEGECEYLGLLKREPGTIMEVSENSASSCYKDPCNGAVRNHVLLTSEFKPFQFIWTIKSASYECIVSYSGRRRRTMTL